MTVLSFTLDVYRLNPWLAGVVLLCTAAASLGIRYRLRKVGRDSRPWVLSVVLVGAAVLLILPITMLLISCLLGGDCL